MSSSAATRTGQSGNAGTVLYLQPDGKTQADGSVTGKLVMIEVSGATHEYHFTSGGKKESKGSLPGLTSEHNLGPHTDDPLQPHAVYQIHDRVPSQKFITSDHDKGYGYFYPIKCANVVGRGSFGIHPSGGDGTTTLGCIGLDDESARRFLADMTNLGGSAPRELEVYTAGQDVSAILAARREKAITASPAPGLIQQPSALDGATKPKAAFNEQAPGTTRAPNCAGTVSAAPSLSGPGGRFR